MRMNENKFGERREVNMLVSYFCGLYYIEESKRLHCLLKVKGQKWSVGVRERGKGNGWEYEL